MRVLLPPAGEVQTEQYELRLIKAPTLKGGLLRAFIHIYEGLLGRRIYDGMATASGITQVLRDIQIPECPLFMPFLPVPETEDNEPGCIILDSPSCSTPAGYLSAMITEGLLPSIAASQAASRTSANAAVTAQYRRPTIANYVAAYTSGSTTPTQALEHIVAFLEKMNKVKCGWFIASNTEEIRSAARDSSARWLAGTPLSVLDGVPFAVKDVMDAEGYSTTAGTTMLSARRGWIVEAPYITHLKQLGAILLGKTSLQEIGLGITGLNPQCQATAKNPYDLTRYCGGSSSGSGAVLAAGVCPIAIGTDGGGSIRIPASFCGVVGLKPTTGRVPSKGAVQGDITVAVLGAMAASVQDTLVLWGCSAHFGGTGRTHTGQPLPALRLPKPWVPAGDEAPLKGCKAGIYSAWFDDADAQVVAACRAAVAELEAAGAVVEELCIPELELLRVAHGITIASEMLHCYQAEVDDPAQRCKFNLETRVGLRSASFWTAADYLQAQRVRARADVHFRRAFKGVDVLITPSTPCTAPPIPPGAITGGLSDLGQVSLIMRFCPSANMLGYPAISVPVGYCNGLPIGLQLMARPWCEGTLLRWAAVLESKILAKSGTQQGPRVWLDPLTGACSTGA